MHMILEWHAMELPSWSIAVEFNEEKHTKVKSHLLGQIANDTAIRFRCGAFWAVQVFKWNSSRKTKIKFDACVRFTQFRKFHVQRQGKMLHARTHRISVFYEYALDDSQRSIG